MGQTNQRITFFNMRPAAVAAAERSPASFAVGERRILDSLDMTQVAVAGAAVFAPPVIALGVVDSIAKRIIKKDGDEEFSYISIPSPLHNGNGTGPDGGNRVDLMASNNGKYELHLNPTADGVIKDSPIGWEHIDKYSGPAAASIVASEAAVSIASGQANMATPKPGPCDPLAKALLEAQEAQKAVQKTKNDADAKLTTANSDVETKQKAVDANPKDKADAFQAEITKALTDPSAKDLADGWEKLKKTLDGSDVAGFMNGAAGSSKEKAKDAIKPLVGEANKFAGVADNLLGEVGPQAGSDLVIAQPKLKKSMDDLLAKTRKIKDAYKKLVTSFEAVDKAASDTDTKTAISNAREVLNGDDASAVVNAPKDSEAAAGIVKELVDAAAKLADDLSKAKITQEKAKKAADDAKTKVDEAKKSTEEAQANFDKCVTTVTGKDSTVKHEPAAHGAAATGTGNH